MTLGRIIGTLVLSEICHFHRKGGYFDKVQFLHISFSVFVHRYKKPQLQLILSQSGLWLIIEAKNQSEQWFAKVFYPKVPLRGDFPWHRIGEGRVSVLSIKVSLSCFRKKRGRGWGGRGWCGSSTRKAKEL